MTCQRGTERRLEAHRVLRQPPPIADERSAVVVDEGKQVGLATGDHRAVEGVAGPQIARSSRLEAAEGLGRRPVGPGVEPEAGEVPLQGALRWPEALDGADDLGHLRRGALGDLTF